MGCPYRYACGAADAGIEGCNSSAASRKCRISLVVTHPPTPLAPDTQHGGIGGLLSGTSLVPLGFPPLPLRRSHRQRRLQHRLCYCPVAVRARERYLSSGPLAPTPSPSAGQTRRPRRKSLPPARAPDQLSDLFTVLPPHPLVAVARARGASSNIGFRPILSIPEFQRPVYLNREPMATSRTQSGVIGIIGCSRTRLSPPPTGLQLQPLHFVCITVLKLSLNRHRLLKGSLVILIPLTDMLFLRLCIIANE